MAGSTTNFNFNLPTVASAIDADLWGTQLNANWTSLDSILVSTSANNTFTGNNTFSGTSGFSGAVSMTSTTAPIINPGAQTADLFTRSTNNSGIVSQHSFDGQNSAAANVTYGRITTAIVDNTAGSEDSTVNIQAQNAGSLSAGIAISGAGDCAFTTVSGGVVADAAKTLTGTVTNEVLTPGGFAGNKNLAAKGFYKLPGGLIIQWGKESAIADAATPTVTFDTAFSSSVFSITHSQTNTSGGNTGRIGFSSITTTNFVITNVSGVTTDVFWMAIGV